MALLLLLSAALVPCLLGMGALRILYGGRAAQQTSPADGVLTGGIICIGLAETAHLTAVVLGWSFSRCIKVFFVGIAVLCVAAAAILFLGRKESEGIRKNRRETGGTAVGQLKTGSIRVRLPWLLFGCVTLAQLIYVGTMQGVDITGDMTLETVNTFLGSDVIYGSNPLTGKPYTIEMPFRLKILCLPTLYGSLCRGFGMGAEQLIYGILPMVVLLAAYLAYGTVAKYLFPEDFSKRGVFMLAVAVLLSVGDYMPGMEGFGVLHCGFRGVAIRGAVLLPYTFGLMLRKKYKLVLLCILAEGCIVWTLYGLGACAFVAAGMLVLRFGIQCYAKRTGREEDVLCRNS